MSLEEPERLVYRPNPTHRNGDPSKSQWEITTPEEEACFRAAETRKWILSQVGWGLHVPNGRPEYLGTSTDRSTRLVFAKFVGAENRPWHGYPADQRRARDIPGEEILLAWMTASLFTRAKIRKIAKGQPCRL